MLRAKLAKLWEDRTAYVEDPAATLARLKRKRLGIEKENIRRFEAGEPTLPGDPWKQVTADIAELEADGAYPHKVDKGIFQREANE